MKCGRQPGGEKVKDLGVCPSAVEIRTDGVHDGRNGGRCCWMLAGTFCKGKVQGSYAAKFGDCKKCLFFRLVLIEEGYNFQTTMQLLRMLNPKNSY